MPQPTLDELRARLGVQPAAYRGERFPPPKDATPHREPGQLGRETYKEREKRRLAQGLHPSGIAPLATEQPAKHEHCGTCGNCISRGGVAGTYYKCLLNEQHWTGGRATDILRRWPACTRWVPRRKGEG